MWPWKAALDGLGEQTCRGLTARKVSASLSDRKVLIHVACGEQGRF